MAAFNGPGQSRKRIATYGKAVRKRPPDHIAFKALQDLERPLGLSRVASITSTSTESVPNDRPSSPSSDSSTKLHIFDVPSSDDDDDNASTTPQKKRKLKPVARAIAPKFANDNSTSNHKVPQHAPEKVVGRHPISKEPSHGAFPDHKHDSKQSSKYQAKAQSTVNRSTFSEAQKPARMSSKRATRTFQTNSQSRVDMLPGHQQNSVLSYHITRNQGSGHSSDFSENQVGPPTISHKTQTTQVVKRPPRPSTPKVADHESHDDIMALTASSILTPKGIKMWNDLLGEDGENLEAESSERSMENFHCGINEHQTSIRKRKLSRRRLIDTLVEQSKDFEPMQDIVPALDDAAQMDSDLVQSFGAVERKEEQSVQIANAPISPERAGKLSKPLGLGHRSQILGAKVTYSRQRSMLAEQDSAMETDFDIPLLGGTPPAQMQNRRVSIPALVPLHSLHENAEAEDGSYGVTIRTIHELRQAGAESRFKDEVEDLLDRIGKPATGNMARRSGLMEMAERMRDKLFYTKFISNGLDQRLFLHLGQEQDVVSGFIFVSILIPILEAGITSMMVTQLRRQGITRLLIRLMSSDDSILAISKDRKINMSKIAQATLIEQHRAFLQLRAWGDLRPQAISPRTASLRCLELMIRQSREAGDTGDIISKELVSNLFTILRDSYDDKATADAAIDFRLALSTLVSHSLNPMIGIEEFLPIVRDILEAIMQRAPEDPNVILLLRLALNTTNNSPAASDALASPVLLQLMSRAVIEKFAVLSGFVIEDKRLILVDNLVLILVVMINIFELSTCARQCFLAIQDSSLADLVKIFQGNIERAFEADSMEDSHLNVAGGYLAVLLGCLSLSPEIRDRIRIQQRTASLQPLIACIDEFISHHKKVDALLKDEEDRNTQIGLTDRLQTLLDKLKVMGVSE